MGKLKCHEQKSMIDIIDETTAAYTVTTRAVNGGGCCVYFEPATGYMCAVGRCLMRPRQFAASFGETKPLDFLELSGPLDDYLRPEYRGHSMEFWLELQQLHDNEEYWGLAGLSSKGASYATCLKQRWAKS